MLPPSRPVEHSFLLQQPGLNSIPIVTGGRLFYIEPDYTYWLSSGNIVLLTVTNVAFKVHWVPLAERSPVLLQAFLSRPERAFLGNSGQSYELLRIGENPRLLKRLLRFVFTPSLPDPEHLTDVEQAYWDVLVAVKYKVAGMIDSHRQTLSRFLEKDPHKYFVVGQRAMHITPVQAIIMLNIARLLRDPSLMPSAIVACAMLPAPDLMSHVTLQADNSTLFVPRDELRICIGAREKLLQASICNGRRIFQPLPSPDCTRRESGRCRRNLARLTLRLLTQIDDREVVGLQPFRVKFGDSDMLPPQYELCWPCREMVGMRAVNVYFELWEDAPCILDLVVPGWNLCGRHCQSPTPAARCTLKLSGDEPVYERDAEETEDESSEDGTGDEEEAKESGVESGYDSLAPR
ncbi:hypothetical protein BD413DRAFT_645046 [Trametes elegans]|nr:hypothetical protein BD413DRAFT_645046 [Trametes elegans]